MNCEIRTASPDDVEAISARAREADVAEMAAMGTTVSEALADGLRRSDWALTGLVGGEPVCMFGVAPVSILNGEGAPWMLATDGLERAQVPFLRSCKPVVREMERSYPRLLNVVDARNTVAIRWLRWLGFRFDETDYRIGGHLFRVFRKGEWNV